MRKWILLSVVTTLLALSAVSMTSMAQTLCNTTKNIVSSINADCVTDSGIGVGLTKRQESKIIAAANLFGDRFSGEEPAGVCIEGTGALYVSRANSNPRQAFFAWYYVTPEGFTCTNLDSPATVILVDGESPLAPGQSPASNPTSGDETTGDNADPEATAEVIITDGGTAFVLNNCTVVTRGILNFRDEPSINSNVLDLIPYMTILKAINRNENWFNVIFGDQNGWIAASLVNTRGRCG